MAEKRRDNKGRVLRAGKSQRSDGKYEYKYVNSNSERHSVYSWKLVATDKVPEGKQGGTSLRDMRSKYRRTWRTTFLFIKPARWHSIPFGINTSNSKKNCNAKEEEDAKAERREPELLSHFSCHHLRHTFCTRFCENETNLKIIQEIMGHADITTPMDIYNEATKDKKMESFAGLEGKIKIR